MGIFYRCEYHPRIMKLELQSAANFLVHLIRLGRRNPSVNEQQLEKFKAAIVEVLRRRYRDHWFPEKPFKGSGYRCIRINGKMDPVIAQAAETCGLAANLIHSTFPSELTMWIDPLEVSYRIGENGSICVLYEHKASKKETTTDPSQPEAWRPTSTSNSTSSTATVVVSNASGPGSGNNTVDNGGLQQFYLDYTSFWRDCVQMTDSVSHYCIFLRIAPVSNQD